MKLEFKILITKEKQIINQSSTSSGRPRKILLESSARSKRMRIKTFKRNDFIKVIHTCSKNGIIFVCWRKTCCRANLISQITDFHPERAIKIRIRYSYDEKNTYRNTRLNAKQRGTNSYPSHIRRLVQKQRWYPPRDRSDWS